MNKNMCWMLIFCAIVLYSLYLMECSYATDNIHLCNRGTENIERVKEKIERMKNSDPVIWYVRAVCSVSCLTCSPCPLNTRSTFAGGRLRAIIMRAENDE